MGALDVIGNPINIVSSVGSGFRDLFYDPSEGVVHSADSFAEGFGKGSLLLAKNSVHALFNSFSKISEKMSKGLAKLTFDKQYQAERKQRYAITYIYGRNGVLFIEYLPHSYYTTIYSPII